MDRIHIERSGYFVPRSARDAESGSGIRSWGHHLAGHELRIAHACIQGMRERARQLKGEFGLRLDGWNGCSGFAPISCLFHEMAEVSPGGS
jgi:hypothetical protein